MNVLTYVSFPQVTEMSDEGVQAAIQRIMLDAAQSIVAGRGYEVI